MGLDMFLLKENYDITDSTREALGDNVKCVITEECYWRKANAIHAWFVREVQDNVDDCGKYPVSREQLEALLSTVSLVIENPELASKVLPPQAGFFFGPTEYDDWYWNSLKHTKEALSRTLSEPETMWKEYYYHSSW